MSIMKSPVLTIFGPGLKIVTAFSCFGFIVIGLPEFWFDECKTIKMKRKKRFTYSGVVVKEFPPTPSQVISTRSRLTTVIQLPPCRF